jgi:hypothetical protein
MADDLYPRVTVRDLPPEVAELREAKAAQEKEQDEHWEPHIQAHIAALADEVDAVIEAHRHLADLTDLDFDADTGWSAIWLLSGRCLAICRVVLHDLRGGFASEAVGTLRSLWEAAMLLAALASSTEDELLRRWLVDDDKGWVRPKEARDAVVRKEARAWTRMEEEGVELPDESVEEAGRDIYDLLSRPAHHRRSGFPESRQVDLRVFAYGPHPSAEVRARQLSYASQFIEVALMVVIGGLNQLYGGGYTEDALTPMMERLETVREQHPLP